jgi:hypothetical protein
VSLGEVGDEDEGRGGRAGFEKKEYSRFGWVRVKIDVGYVENVVFGVGAELVGQEVMAISVQSLSLSLFLPISSLGMLLSVFPALSDSSGKEKRRWHIRSVGFRLEP